MKWMIIFLSALMGCSTQSFHTSTPTASESPYAEISVYTKGSDLRRIYLVSYEDVSQAREVVIGHKEAEQFSSHFNSPFRKYS